MATKFELMMIVMLSYSAFLLILFQVAADNHSDLNIYGEEVVSDNSQWSNRDDLTLDRDTTTPRRKLLGLGGFIVKVLPRSNGLRTFLPPRQSRPHGKAAGAPPVDLWTDLQKPLKGPAHRPRKEPALVKSYKIRDQSKQAYEVVNWTISEVHDYIDGQCPADAESYCCNNDSYLDCKSCCDGIRPDIAPSSAPAPSPFPSP